MATLEQIQAKVKKLQAQAEAMLVAKSHTVLKQIRELMEKHGLTTADLDSHTGGKKRGPKPGTKVAAKTGASVAKYRDPKSGASWTGHGRAPAWIANAKDRSKFLVDGVVAKASSAVATQAKSAGKGYPRGPQPAKYRDPKTGATWSGRGPAPAWLSTAKDRSRFLIAGADAGKAVATTPAKKVAKKAVVKKTVAKKAASKTTVAASKKPAAKSASAAVKKAAVKKAAVKKTAVKKVAVKKPAVKKPAVKKVAGKKAAAKQAPATAAPAPAVTDTSAVTSA